MAAPSKLTPKQEKFAQVYVQTGNASEAYRTAYDVREGTKQEAIWVNACQTLSNAKVAQRVVELQDALQSKHEVTADTIAKELAEDREFAKDVGQAGAAVSATMGKAKLYGLITDKQAVKHDVSDPLQAVLLEVASKGARIGKG